MATAAQRSKVFQTFKLSGLTLEAPAARFLLDVFKSHTADQLDVALEGILRAVKLLVLSSSVVPLSAVQEALKAAESSVGGDEVDDVMIISAADCPNLEYDGRRKTFIKALSRDSNILTGASLRSRFSWYQQNPSRF